jgi:hypothetical protein
LPTAHFGVSGRLDFAFAEVCSMSKINILLHWLPPLLYAVIRLQLLPMLNIGLASMVFFSSRVVAEQEPVTDGQLNEVNEAAVDENAAAMIGSDGTAGTDPAAGLAPAVSAAICLNRQ